MTKPTGAVCHLATDEVRAGRDATGLHDWYATADAQRGRDDSCSSGGAKWMRCHGAAA